MLFIGGLVVPVQLIILPLFIMFRQIGILGDLRSLIAVYSVFGIPLGVLVLTGFFAALPRDLEEAARIDGASHFEVFWRIMLPLTRPAIAAVVILNGVWMWNDFFLGFILLTETGRHDAAGGHHGLPRHLLHRVGSHLRQRHGLGLAGGDRLPVALPPIHRRADRGVSEGIGNCLP